MAEVRTATRWWGRRLIAGSVVAGVLLGAVAGMAGVAGAAGPSTNRAKGELLKLSDLPKGWSQSGNITSSTGGLPTNAAMAGCLGLPASVVNATPPTVGSPSFALARSAQSVTAAIELYSSATQAKAQYRAFSSRKAPGCWSLFFNGPEKQQLTGGFGAGLTTGAITVTKLSSAYTPRGTTGVSLNFTVSTNSNSSVKGQVVLLFGQKGSQGMVLTLTSVINSFPARLAKHLASVELGRI